MRYKREIFILSLCLICSILFAFNLFAASTTGSDSALSDAKLAMGSQTCACKPIAGYKVSASSVMCTYTPTSGGMQSKQISCNMAEVNDTIKRYVVAGIFGDECRTEYANSQTLCTDAVNFLSEAESYAGRVQEGLYTKTKNGMGTTTLDADVGPVRFNRAMDKFNENAHFVYSFLIGFGFITSIIVFILIFMKILWLPDHPIKRREAMEDIVTSGIATILLGGIWLFISVFQSIFDRFWSSYAVYSKDWRSVGNIFLYEYKGLITGILGVATLTAILMFVKNFIGLSLSGGNPQSRKQKMTGILICGLASAGLGALLIFVGFFWGMLQ